MENYTKLLKILIEENKYDDEYILDVLNNEEEDFKTFSELLKREIYLKTNSTNEKETLKKCFKEKNISFNRNTLENWFDDTTPKKSDETREHMYKIAFALECSIEETERLFKKVYRDRPFNIRRMNEFVYYVCINNKYDYHYAQEIIEEAMQIEKNDSVVESTQKLLNDIKILKTKKHTLQYIKDHYASFSFNNLSAKKVVNSLIEDIIVKDEEIELIKKRKITKENSILAQEVHNNPELFTQNKNMMTSISGMLTYIYNVDFHSYVSQKYFQKTVF